MSYLLTTRLACRNIFSVNNSFLLKRLYTAKVKGERKAPSGCIQHIYQRPYETHDDKNRRLKRPLTPCLSIYKIQLCSICSITHRITGIVGSGYLVLLGFFSLLSSHDLEYACQYVECMRIPVIIIAFFKFGIGFPYVYHSINGLRHLAWDTGRFLEMRTIIYTGIVTMAIATVTTIGAIIAL